MNKLHKFYEFLASLKNNSNSTLIESIHSGFTLCFEDSTPPIAQKEPGTHPYDGEKTLDSTVLDGRIKVFLIDGKLFRDKTDTDFALGGNHEAYPTEIPENEIWLEKILTDPNDKYFIIVHELVEQTIMKYHGYSYPKAHQIANIVEHFERQQEKPDSLESLEKKFQYKDFLDNLHEFEINDKDKA